MDDFPPILRKRENNLVTNDEPFSDTWAWDPGFSFKINWSNKATASEYFSIASLTLFLLYNAFPSSFNFLTRSSFSSSERVQLSLWKDPSRCISNSSSLKVSLDGGVWMRESKSWYPTEMFFTLAAQQWVSGSTATCSFNIFLENRNIIFSCYSTSKKSLCKPYFDLAHFWNIALVKLMTWYQGFDNRYSK